MHCFPQLCDLLPRIPLSARTILDIGCGTGELTAAYRPLNPNARLLGIEPDEAAAVIAGRHLDQVVSSAALRCAGRHRLHHL
jgi:tRNA G46 methylase TrmB